MKLFEKFDEKKISTLLRMLFAVMVIFVASGCSDDDAIKAYEQYKVMTAVETFEVSECFYCKIFIMTFNAMGDVASQAVRDTRAGALTLLAMVYALWLLSRIFIIVVGAKFINLREQWSEILVRTFFLLIASTFLASDDNMAELYGYTMIPLMTAATDLSVEYANIASEVDASGNSVNLSGACNQMVLAAPAGLMVIPREMGEKFACVLMSINRVIYKMHLIASVVKEEINICDVSIINGTIECPGIYGYLTALFMMAVAFILTLFYPLYLLDFVLRAGIIAVLMPFLIFAWVFPFTRGFVEMAFQMVLNMCIGVMVLTLLLTGVVTVMDMIIMDTYLIDTSGNPIDLKDIAIYGSDLTAKLVGKAPQIQFIGFAQMVFVGLVSIYMIKQSLAITNAFANVSGLDSVGGAIVKAFAKTMKFAINTVSAIADVVSVAAAVASAGASTVFTQGAKMAIGEVAKLAVKQGVKAGGNKFKERARSRIKNKVSRSFKYTDASGNRRKLKHNVYKDFKSSSIGKAAGYANYVGKQFKRK